MLTALYWMRINISRRDEKGKFGLGTENQLWYKYVFKIQLRKSCNIQHLSRLREWYFHVLKCIGVDRVRRMIHTIWRCVMQWARRPHAKMGKWEQKNIELKVIFIVWVLRWRHVKDDISNILFAEYLEGNSRLGQGGVRRGADRQCGKTESKT